MTQDKIVVVNNVRYRHEDARRLGLIADGKAFTGRSKNVGEPDQGTPPANSPDPAEGDTAPAATSPNQAAVGPVRPARNASRDEWAEYAKVHGVSEEDLHGLKRDEISELFPDDTTEDTDQ